MSVDKNQPILMCREDMANIPQFDLPEDYAIKWYEPGDEEAWIDIHLKSDEFNKIDLKLYEREFGIYVDALMQRQLFLYRKKDNYTFATATAWYDCKFKRNIMWGRIHWVAIDSAMQGKGLAKPLMTIICNRLILLGHKCCYLSTASVRLPAISLYLKFGFQPEINSPEDKVVWDDIFAALKKQ